MFSKLHKDSTGFQAALEFTSRETGFRIDLIEKDYYCSIVLAYLFHDPDEKLVFKGGTSLNKVHLGFYRLSEDLDFTIPIRSEASREVRRKAIEPLKTKLDNLEKHLPGVRLKIKLTGSNESRQYNALLEYDSSGSASIGTIKLEVGLREELLAPAARLGARTLLMDPFTRQAVVSDVIVNVLTKDEAYSEKVRAALTRKDPAIRDWFDLDHAVESAGLDVTRAEFLELVRRKLLVPGSRVSDESTDRHLMKQLDSELKPVLRGRDFSAFDLNRAMDVVKKIRKELARKS